MNVNTYGSRYYGSGYYGYGDRYVRKFFVYKVYNSAGDFITTWSDDVLSIPKFSTAINSAPGQMTVKLARAFDNYGEEDDVAFANRVDVYCFDSDSPGVGVLIYRGFISTYSPNLQRGQEYVVITLLPYISLAAKTILKDASNNTTVQYLSQDPSTIFRSILGLAVAAGLRIDTTATSIDITQSVVSYTYNTNTIKEALDKALELTPDGWYWRVDPDDTVHLHQQPATVTHDLLIGQHIVSANPEKRIENIVNRVYVTGGGDPPLYRVYERSSSISAYGLREAKVVDQRVTDPATALIMATRILDAQEAPETRIKMTIVDNNGQLQDQGYDIESIKIGDTIRIKNLQFGSKSESLWDVAEWDVDVWDQTLASIAGNPLLVVKLNYNGDTIDVETSSQFPVVSKRIEDINRNLVNTQTVNNPAAPS